MLQTSTQPESESLNETNSGSPTSSLYEWLNDHYDEFHAEWSNRPDWPAFANRFATLGLTDQATGKPITPERARKTWLLVRRHAAKTKGRPNTPKETPQPPATPPHPIATGTPLAATTGPLHNSASVPAAAAKTLRRDVRKSAVPVSTRPRRSIPHSHKPSQPNLSLEDTTNNESPKNDMTETRDGLTLDDLLTPTSSDDNIPVTGNDTFPSAPRRKTGIRSAQSKNQLDITGELKALEDRARALRTKQKIAIGEVTIAIGIGKLFTTNELAGLLLDAIDRAKANPSLKEDWARSGEAFFLRKPKSGNGAASNGGGSRTLSGEPA